MKPSMLAGSMGMLPSSLGERLRRRRYRPRHVRADPRAQAPDIAGQGKANPLAAVLNAADDAAPLLLGLDAEADAMERAVDEALAAGYRTGDIAAAGATLTDTVRMGDEVAARI
ncbi:MAG: isocitrate/isopropylmalate family dehydrogenase [Dehalococcoidia bacterium]